MKTYKILKTKDELNFMEPTNKVIMVLSDALRYDTAVAGMGFLGHLVETQQASLYKVDRRTAKHVPPNV